MIRFIVPLVIALATACAGHTTVAYTAPASTTLVEVRPGLFVLADYHEPVFFADDYYWRLYGGRWYRSTWHGGGWVAASPPSIVVSVDRPHRYVRYRPAPRDRVVVRDHRGRWRR
jgi:hypothetical protein